MERPIPNSFDSIMPIGREFQIRHHNRQAQSTEYGPVFPTYEAASKAVDMKLGVPVAPVTKVA